MIKLLPPERPAVAAYIHQLCSLSLDASKDYLVESRLSPLAEELLCRSFTDLVQRARADASGVLPRRIVDQITTHETLFFRDDAPFELLRYKLLPDLIDRRSKTAGRVPIRIWSAACSTGQEVYSIAIAMKEAIGDPSRYNIRLIGTDISDSSIAAASEGVFNAVEISRGLREDIASKYFAPFKGGWKVREEIRAMASFRRLNLMDDFSALGTFDIVFCRNVAIYFNEADRISLFNRITQRMERDGQLIIGSMESLNGISSQLDSKRHLRSVYYELKKPDHATPPAAASPALFPPRR